MTHRRRPTVFRRSPATARLAAGALALALVGAAPLMAQDAGTLAVRGAKIFTLTGPPIENGTVLMQNGKITAVGASVSIPSGATTIDGSGLQVYPGLFDAASQLGLTEIGAVDVTQDLRELGEFNPHLLAASAVHPATEHIPVARANGITHAVALPQPRPGGIGGQGSLIDLDGWTIEDMLVQPSVGMVLAWPTIQTRRFNFETFSATQRSYREAKKEYDEQVTQIEQWLEAARRYDKAVSAGDSLSRDLKLEALAKVTRGALPLLIMANQERDISNAIDFAERHHVKMVLLGGREAWKVKDSLAAKHIPVILGPTQELPTGEDEAYDEMYAQPGQLFHAGVTFALSTFSSSDARTLPYEIGNAVPYGLPWEEAIKAITIYPAEILGVDDKLGTIEAGKIANLIVTDGDPLAIQTQVRRLIIAGREVSTDNKQLELYKKYRARPKHVERQP